VKNFRHISIKKPSALLFMALMIFINAVKLFHSHHELTNASQHTVAGYLGDKSTSPPIKVSRDNRCPICDFSLMKDGNIAYADIIFFIRTSDKAAFASPLPSYLFRFSISSKDRAPPVLVS
jgi:hypothetical protein